MDETKSSEFVAYGAGNKPKDHYAQRLSPLQYKIRNILLPYIRAETPILGDIQQRSRSKFLDHYFTQAANLGSHTFYVLLLPLSFWLGYSLFGRNLVYVLAFGVYLTNFLKDYLCLPRPLSPPLHRLTMSKDSALEYGFPSTHTANAVSVSLLVATVLVRSYREEVQQTGEPHLAFYVIMHIINTIYILSLVAGRIYCGMHGFLDLAGGALIGIFVYLFVGPAFAWFLNTLMTFQSGIGVFVCATTAILFLIRIHPEPADDCPCFEDSVAFLGVLLGELLAEWSLYNAFENAPEIKSQEQFQLYLTSNASTQAQTQSYLTSLSSYFDYLIVNAKVYHKYQPGSYITESIHNIPGSPTNTIPSMIKYGFLRFVIGVVLVAVWKTYSKKALLLILPPIWRFIESIGLSMPRRFYIPASQYKEVPSDKIPDKTLHFLPLKDSDSEEESYNEIIEFPKINSTNSSDSATLNSEINVLKHRTTPGQSSEISEEPPKSHKRTRSRKESVGPQSAADVYEALAIKQKQSETPGCGCQNKTYDEDVPEEFKAKIIVPRPRYDVEVITKLIVYAGIAWIAVFTCPLVFAVLNI